MSSSFVVESHQSGSKKDDTLIIVVNDDGTISVDQETLQNLIMNQSDAKVSVVRVGQSEGDAENGDLTLTVDPPTFERPATTENSAGTTDVAGLVDPFMEMDPEQLEKLEEALQSEQAKQILGENVTAMLDMLTVEEQQKSIKYCIELDHCYTTRTSPADPEPSDPLPVANSPDIVDNLEPNKHSSVQQVSSPVQPVTDTSLVDNLTTPNARSKILPRNTCTRSIVGRGRKITTPLNQQAALAKSSGSTPGPRHPPGGLAQQSPIRGVSTSVRVEAERKEDESSATSSESSESEPPSDDDSDFGPRGPRRGGLRARGGRKGLTTRGGSTSATRRRSANKQMDMDQVRRLDMEMAAAVVAMKSPEKIDRPERFSPARGKKQRTRSVSGRKKEDAPIAREIATEMMTTAATTTTTATTTTSPSPSGIPETPPSVIEKPLQTTNQVKADLISANMIKGDMILTKPGQGRYNQKVVLVQKKLMVRPNEFKPLAGNKRQSLVLAKAGKTTTTTATATTTPLQIQTKLATSEEGKLVTATSSKSNLESQQIKASSTTTVSDTCSPLLVSPSSTCSSASILGLEQQQQQQQQVPPRIDTPPSQLPQQLLQHEQRSAAESPPAPSPPLRTKSIEIKREKRKSESDNKPEDIFMKNPEAKTPDASKKHVKKDPRKAPAALAGLGPALFSTPDIIRRVGSDAKSSVDHPGTPTMLLQESLANAASILENPETIGSPGALKNPGETLSIEPRTAATTTTCVLASTNQQEISSRDEHDKTESKVITAEELESSLDPTTNVTPSVDNPEPIQPTEAPVVPNANIPEQSGIEGEEHLLATLEMEAGKHDEELLAEALLLQEELGDDLADHPVLAESSNSSIGAEPLLASRTSTFEEPMETDAKVPKVVESVKSASTITLIASTSVHASPKTLLDTSKKRDEKEPIQIIRGGRVITLPPIEAPATRSKRLQAKPDSPQKAVIEIAKKEEKILKPSVVSQQQKAAKEFEETDRTFSRTFSNEIENSTALRNVGGNEEEDDDAEDDDDEDDDDDEEEGNSDSEDDPDRLWCICKRPHNNRFMICCDVCEDWFHGKCVHVSKAMGQQMEEKGIEWVCPNCLKKKDQGNNSSIEQKKLPSAIGKASLKEDAVAVAVVSTPRAGGGGGGGVSSNEKVAKTPSQTAVAAANVGAPTISTAVPGVTQCVVCKKEARNSSIYCSDACILAHAQETLTRDSKPSPTPSQPKVTQAASETPKPTADPRVIVFEKRTGKVLTGVDAPTRSNLKNWLKDNPTFEVVRPNNLNTLQIGGKTVTAIQTQGIGKMMKSGNPGTSSTSQGKMVYAKVMGSKQTVLSPSNKKLVLVSGAQQRLSPKTIQQKPQGSPLVRKSPVLRQTTIKIVSQQGKAAAAAATATGAAGSPKHTVTKKQESAKAASGPQQQQQQQKTPPVTKRSEPEPIRLNVRKTLTELLTTRIRESKDLSLSDEEISELALNIELELYKCFRDTGAKYKSKYRSLVFNIKDTKNLTLYRKIADRSLTPDAVVRLSPDEMASQELAEWREKETKHQLEMIKKNELDLMSQAKSIVVKTHKGELIIENDASIDHVDPKTPVQDIVTALNSQEAGDEARDAEVDDDSNSKEPKDDKSHSLSSEDSKWSKSSATSIGGGGGTSAPSEDRKKKDREKTRDKERGDGAAKSCSKSADKEGDKVTRSKRLEEEDRRRSHGTGRSRRSRDRERSRDRKSTRSKDGKRSGGGAGGLDTEKESKDREQRHKSSSGRQRDKERDRRSRGKKDRASKSRGNRDEDCGGRGSGGKRDGSERGKEGSQSGVGEDAKPIEDRLWRHIEEDSGTTTTIAGATATRTTMGGSTFDGNDSDVSDREPSSTVNIRTPDINDEAETREKEAAASAAASSSSSTGNAAEHSQLEKRLIASSRSGGPSQTVWRGFVNMVDVAKFFITATEVSGHAKDLMDNLPDTVDVIGRISHDTVWEYILKMKRSGTKEILVIRLTAANDEEKIPYITLYSYLNSRSRLGVVGNVSRNIKDFYIMPFSRQSHIPSALLPLVGPGFEDERPHLLLGIIVRHKRKRVSTVASPVIAPPTKILKKEEEDASLDKNMIRHHHHHHHHHLHQSHLQQQQQQQQQQSPPDSPRPIHKGLLLESLREKQTNVVTQMTLDSLNKAHVGMSKGSAIDNATISKLVPELSSKIDLTESPKGETTSPPPPSLQLLATSITTTQASLDGGGGGGGISEEMEPDDGDEPYSPGGASDLDEARNSDNISISESCNVLSNAASIAGLSSPNKNSTELQRKMDELNRQIEEQKQQIQSISSCFLGDPVSTLPGLGLDPPDSRVGEDSDEAYSPTDARSFTPPPPSSGIAKFAQPILDKVSDITIPPNLQEILANVKRQESSKVDPYLPSKPSATFLTSANATLYPVKSTEKYTPTFINKSLQGATAADTTTASPKETTKSTLRSLSDLDLIKKAEEELAAVAAQSVPPAPPPVFTSPPPPLPPLPLPPLPPSPTATNRLSPQLAEKMENIDYPPPGFALEDRDNKKTGGSISMEQPKPPGLEDEDLPPIFPASAPTTSLEPTNNKSPPKFVSKSGVVLSSKRKGSEDLSASPTKTPRTKSRWGQGPTE